MKHFNINTSDIIRAIHIYTCFISRLKYFSYYKNRCDNRENNNQEKQMRSREEMWDVFF